VPLVAPGTPRLWRPRAGLGLSVIDVVALEAIERRATPEPASVASRRRSTAPMNLHNSSDRRRELSAAMGPPLLRYLVKPDQKRLGAACSIRRMANSAHLVDPRTAEPGVR
jgi:hypothetical protein